MYFYRTIKIKRETSLALFSTLVATFKEDKLYEYFVNNFVAFALDGAPVMTGKKLGLSKLINETVSANIFMIHCLAHKLQVAAHHAMEAMQSFNENMESFVNGVYSFFIKNLLQKSSH